MDNCLLITRHGTVVSNEFPKKKGEKNPAGFYERHQRRFSSSIWMMRGFDLCDFRRLVRLTHGTSRGEHVAGVTLNNFLSIRLSPMARDVKEARLLCGVPVPIASLIKGLIVWRAHEKPKEKTAAAINYVARDSPLLL